MTITMNIEKDIFVHLASSTQGVFPLCVFCNIVPACFRQVRRSLTMHRNTAPICSSTHKAHTADFYAIVWWFGK